ncbi:MAG: exopolysaccharide biosynthesis protein [Alphaproteobacteria bacterium]
MQARCCGRIGEMWLGFDVRRRTALTNPPVACATLTIDTAGSYDHTSERLRSLVSDAEHGCLSIDAIAGTLRNRALGMSMLIFAIPCCLPMPPGVPVLSGIGLAVVAIHLMILKDELWLPRFIGNRQVATADLERLLKKIVPHVERVESFCKPRLMAMTSGLPKMIVGLVTLILGLLLILPIPLFGNLPPGLAAAMLAIGLAERDGAIVGLGLLCSIVAIGVTSAAGWGVFLALGRLIA